MIRTLKDNGYKAETLQESIKTFDYVAELIFGDNVKVNHFYYGDNCDMADVVLDNGEYAHFCIYSKGTHLTGYTLSNESMKQMIQLTVNDPCYK